MFCEWEMDKKNGDVLKKVKKFPFSFSGQK